MKTVVIGGHTRNIGKTSVMAGLIRGLASLGWTAVKITQYGHGVCSLDGEPRGRAPTPVNQFRSLVLKVLLFASAICLCGPGVVAQTDARLASAERINIASQIYALVKLYFAHGESLDIDDAYRHYLEQIANISGRKEFDLATLKFTAALKNGHTHFFDDWLANNYGQPLPFWIEQLDDQWVITSSHLPNLPVGSVVTKIEAKPIDEFVNSVLPYIEASNDRLARSHIGNYPFLFPQTFSLTLDSGKKVPVERTSPSNPRASGSPASEGRWLTEATVAYIKIPSFGDPAYERTAIELEAKYHQAKVLIVDVRGNGGGRTPFDLISVLMNRTWRTWNEFTPQHIALFEAQGQAPRTTMLHLPSRKVEPDPRAFQGRVILLADRYCGSACEDLVMPFKDSGRAIIIGETTQGSSGQPFRMQLYQGMTIMIGAVRFSFPDGDEFESVGISPTIAVPVGPADLAAGRDPVLEKAEEVAQ